VIQIKHCSVCGAEVWATDTDTGEIEYAECFEQHVPDDKWFCAKCMDNIVAMEVEQCSIV
jgi:hypothetical protein